MQKEKKREKYVMYRNFEDILLAIYTLYLFSGSRKKICISRLHVKEVWCVSKCFYGGTHNSVMNSESSDHVLNVASWLFGQHMFLTPSVHTLQLTYERHQ